MITNQLRHLAVTVDEQEPGQFYWVLIESVDDATVWKDLKASEESFSSWFAAWELGNKELLKMVPDKKTGPLARNDHEISSPKA
ncbi:MAG: hypothetical protein V4451_16835 [Pseudomonadota bacterium]